MNIFQKLAAKIWKPIVPLPRSAPCLFGFYQSDDAQVEEVRDCTDIHWECFQDGPGPAFARIVAAKKPTVVDLTWCMFEGVKPFRLRADAENNLNTLRGQFIDLGIWRNINWITPIDEPDINTTPADQHAANLIIRRVFPESRLLVCFAGFKRLTCIEDYDDVLADDYDAGEGIFDITLPWPPRSDFDRLLCRLRPDQSAGLVIGGGDPWRQDPSRFIEVARQFGQVRFLLAFLLIKRFDCNPPAAGIRTNGMLDTYRGVRERLQ